MRRLYLFLFVLVLAFSVSMGQVFKYVFDRPFPDTTGTNAFKLPFGVINVGLGVDPAGKVWIQAYSNSSSSTDSIVNAAGTKVPTRPIYVF
ncbi:MAG TPA: hypothetical protein VI704_08345, partial [Bacteroidota bacterium]|nr:hypothetical protein [Bacteroidota bacterium]